MKDPNLFLVKRHFEILLEAFQGVEGLASHSDCDSVSVGKAMVPIIFQAEELLKDINTLYQRDCEVGASKSSSTDLGNIVIFPREGID
jgi:hypothetical protein